MLFNDRVTKTRDTCAASNDRRSEYDVQRRCRGRKLNYAGCLPTLNTIYFSGPT